MIQQIDNKTGRNDDCPCESGKKYKNCCMPKAPLKALTPGGLNKCFLLLVKATDGIVISSAEIDALDKDEELVYRHDPKDDTFHFKAVQVEKKLIVTPDKRIRI